MPTMRANSKSLDLRFWLLPLLFLWALLAAHPFAPKTASGQNSALETASTAGSLWEAAPRLGFRAVAEKWTAVPLVGNGVRGAADNLAGPTPTVTVNSQGLTEIKPATTPVNRQDMLNTVDAGGNGKLKPAEAAAAAQLEPALGTMQRYDGASTVGNKKPDFQITDGPNAGKTVDLMYTTATNSEKEIAGLNAFFEKTMTEPSGGGLQPRGVSQIQDHLAKADLVVMDLRPLTPRNQQILREYINTLPPAQQKQIVIIGI